MFDSDVDVEVKCIQLHLKCLKYKSPAGHMIIQFTIIPDVRRQHGDIKQYSSKQQGDQEDRQQYQEPVIVAVKQSTKVTGGQLWCGLLLSTRKILSGWWLTVKIRSFNWVSTAESETKLGCFW